MLKEKMWQKMAWPSMSTWKKKYACISPEGVKRATWVQLRAWFQHEEGYGWEQLNGSISEMAANQPYR